MLLNCDLGESHGERRVGDDAAVMPYLDQANIACGFHGGDPLTISNTLRLAMQYGVAIGAHPSYPDREGFGRRSMTLDEDTMIATLHYQISALDGMARCAGTALQHVKPHGALYNDMMASEVLLNVIMRAIAAFPTPLPLILQSTPRWRDHLALADRVGIAVQFEVFADRRYLSSGALLPRSEAGAVLNANEALRQARQLLDSQQVTCTDGSLLHLQADTLCIHGDHAEAARCAAQIRSLMQAR
ncbi:MAG: LamB/YcsF family protein [Gammaproteobacteria bacterium]|nr:LamB/YcsF family protein [Gammaproteobacteria bacterium]